MLPKGNFKTPLLQFIQALEVAKNGRPKITGIEVLECEIGCVSKTIKSTGK
jgi:hypothetical protein